MTIDTVWALVAAGTSVFAALVSAWFARQATSASVRRDVDELMATVEKFTRLARRETMRRVRQGEPIAADDAPPQLRSIPTPAESKAQLRSRLLSRGHQ